jgi:hypothetical protein
MLLFQQARRVGEMDGASVKAHHTGAGPTDSSPLRRCNEKRATRGGARRHLTFERLHGLMFRLKEGGKRRAHTDSRGKRRAHTPDS